MIKLTDVNLAYHKRTPLVLERINLEIGPREIVSLVGPSGCGKTTLLRLIAGTLVPQAGEVTVFGKKVTPGQHNLGFMPQDSLLFPWRTILANVRLPLELKSKEPESVINIKAKRALELVHLNGIEKKYPHQLSGGMIQRVALARALVNATEIHILLLDEPFASLDDLTRTKLNLELLRIQAQTGVAVLLVTHNLFEAIFLSHRVVVMGQKPGRILGEVSIPLEWPRSISMIGNQEFCQVMSTLRSWLEQEGENYSDDREITEGTASVL